MMFRLALAALLAMLALLSCGPVQASSDYQCDPGWMLDFTAKPECANVAALVPGNDTRANSALLLADRNRNPASDTPAKRPLLAWQDFRPFFSRQAPTDAGLYASGEGSRCRSDGAGAKAFSDAVEAAKGLSPDERKTLIDAREIFTPQCEGKTSASPAAEVSVEVTSPEGRAFAAYLHAAGAFYAGQFDEAAAGFERLRSDPDPWLADTAAYMVARTAINQMQEGAFEPYGTLRGSSTGKGAAQAAASLEAYLRDRPNGRCAVSARGLQRRVAWLDGSTQDLAARYAAIIAESEEARGIDDAALAEEIDNKLLPTLGPEMTPNPILLAVLDLRAMRRGTSDTPQATRPDLAAQRDAFASAPSLYEFLESAAAFYLDGRPRAVIETIPDDTRRRGGDYLWFSRQLLRGLALEAVGDRSARGFWKDLMLGATRPLDRSATQLALALDDDRRGDPDDAFAAGSPLNDPAIRAILIHNAGSVLLRHRARDADAAPRERQIALFTLLTKEVTRGLYRDFLADVASVSTDAPTEGSVVVDPVGDGAVPLGLFIHGETAGDIGCPPLITTATRLASDPGGVRDRFYLAEWLRLNGFDPDHFATPPIKGELGFGPSAFLGRSSTRLDIYRAVIAERAAPPDGRAYALYRAVKCYEPSGYDACGGADASKSERRRWYDALKRDYPGSRWALALPYWW